MQGTTLQNSDYQLAMLENTTCNVLCRRVYTDDEVSELVEKIDKVYHLHWCVPWRAACECVRMCANEHTPCPFAGSWITCLAPTASPGAPTTPMASPWVASSRRLTELYVSQVVVQVDLTAWLAHDASVFACVPSLAAGSGVTLPP